MLISDITRDAEQGLHLAVEPDAAGDIAMLNDAFSSIAVQAKAAIAEDGYIDGVSVELSADLRYRGQSHELTVSLIDGHHAHAVREAVHRAHRERFGFASPDVAVEVVTARAKARHVGYRGSVGGSQASANSDSVSARVTWDRERETRILERGSVTEPVSGPAIVTQIDTTVTVPPGWTAAPLPSGSLLLTRSLKVAVMSSVSINPARLAIFDSLVSSIAEEMGATLRHTSLSPNIKERADFSCAVFDHVGQLLAQAAHIPVHLGAMPESVRAVERLAPWRPGDLAILNDPFLGGTHLPDVTMVSPVFAHGAADGDEPIGYVASRAHQADIGGMAPGRCRSRVS